MNTKRKSSKKVVRVVRASVYRHLDKKVNREKKQSKALRRMRLERDVNRIKKRNPVRSELAGLLVSTEPLEIP